MKLQTYPEGVDESAAKALVRVRIPMVKEEHEKEEEDEGKEEEKKEEEKPADAAEPKLEE